MDSESNNGGQDQPAQSSDLVELKTFSDFNAADLARAKLEALGIECWLSADDGGGMYPSLDVAQGVKLLTRPADRDRAKALIPSFPTSLGRPPYAVRAAASATPDAKGSKIKLSFPQLFSGALAGVVLCLLYQWTSRPKTTTQYHYNQDGKRDEAWVYRDGRLAEHMQDRNLDGVWDYWAYHKDGAVVRSELDNNFDGKPDQNWTYSNRDLVSAEIDADFNGTPDWFSTYRYGTLQQADMKPNGSKCVSVHEVFQNGVLAEIWRGGDSNGNFKEIVRYDPFFNPISTNVNGFQLLSPSSK